jgi:hypothetical protein
MRHAAGQHACCLQVQLTAADADAAGYSHVWALAVEQPSMAALGLRWSECAH